MTTGTVKWFNSTKGYGFITPDDGSADVFLHVSSVEASSLTNIQEGSKLNFDVEVGRNGKHQAINLKAG